MVFPVVMYGCESWTIKKAERQRIDAFELWCWRRLLRVPWTSRRSNKSILKEIGPECSLEGIPGMISFRMDWLDLLAVQGMNSSTQFRVVNSLSATLVNASMFPKCISSVDSVLMDPLAGSALPSAGLTVITMAMCQKQNS